MDSAATEELLGHLFSLLFYAGIPAGGLALRYWSRHKERIRLKRRLRRYRPSTLDSKPQGPVRITGTARALDGLLEAPLSGQKVIGYRLLIGQQATSRGGISSFLILHDEFKALPFVMDDGTGTSAVGARQWHLIGLPDLANDYVAKKREIPDFAWRRVQASSANLAEDMFNQVHLLILEQGFAEGAEVAVYGDASTVVDSAAQNVGYREPPLKTEIGEAADEGIYVSQPAAGAIWKALSAREELKRVAAMYNWS